jgi:hypothetical protein
VIIRISGDGQYEVADDLYDELNRLDNETVGAVEADDEARFNTTFGALIEMVRTRGTRLGDEELHESKVILPPADLTLAEAEHEFTGDGLLPD